MTWPCKRVPSEVLTALGELAVTHPPQCIHRECETGFVEDVPPFALSHQCEICGEPPASMSPRWCRSCRRAYEAERRLLARQDLPPSRTFARDRRNALARGKARPDEIPDVSEMRKFLAARCCLCGDILVKVTATNDVDARMMAIRAERARDRLERAMMVIPQCRSCTTHLTMSFTHMPTDLIERRAEQIRKYQETRRRILDRLGAVKHA